MTDDQQPSSGPIGARRFPPWFPGVLPPAAGILAGALAARAVYLPLVVVPLVGSASYAEDNAARGQAVLWCAVAVMVCFAGRLFRAALLANGCMAGLLLASALEKIKDWHALQASTRVPPGAGELTRQYAAMSAQTLAATHPRIGAFLLPAGCLLGVAAASAGSWRAARRSR